MNVLRSTIGSLACQGLGSRLSHPQADLGSILATRQSETESASAIILRRLQSTFRNWHSTAQAQRQLNLTQLVPGSLTSEQLNTGGVVTLSI